MDHEYYEAPEDFQPERFIKNEFGFKDNRSTSEGLRKTYAFGAGRRICPGQHLAENSLVRSGHIVLRLCGLEHSGINFCSFSI